MHHQSGRPKQSVTERAREMLPDLPSAQRAVAELMVANPGGVAELTILDLADYCGVSTGSITRLCRALGYSGYSALRIALAADGGRTESDVWESNIGPDIAVADDLAQVALVVSDAVTTTVSGTLKHIDVEAVENAAKAIASARRVHICGFGGSGASSTEFMGRLHRIGIPTWAVSDVHTAMSGMVMLTEGDVAVAVSHSGQTKEVVSLVAEAAAQGATVVAVTNRADTPVTQHADIVITTHVGDEGLRSEGVLARHAQLAVLDLLYIATVQLTSTQSTDALTATADAVREHLGRAQNDVQSQ